MMQKVDMNNETIIINHFTDWISTKRGFRLFFSFLHLKLNEIFNTFLIILTLHTARSVIIKPH